MALVAYQGHVSYGSFVQATTNPEVVCPADRPSYDSSQFVTQPGAAARANGYPRSDGRPGRG